MGGVQIGQQAGRRLVIPLCFWVLWAAGGGVHCTHGHCHCQHSSRPSYGSLWQILAQNLGKQEEGSELLLAIVLLLSSERTVSAADINSPSLWICDCMSSLVATLQHILQRDYYNNKLLGSCQVAIICNSNVQTALPQLLLLQLLLQSTQCPAGAVG